MPEMEPLYDWQDRIVLESVDMDSMELERWHARDYAYLTQLRERLDDDEENADRTLEDLLRERARLSGRIREAEERLSAIQRDQDVVYGILESNDPEGE